MGIQFAFRAQVVDHTGDGTLTDGSVMWEVVTTDGDTRIATCETQETAEELEQALNLALTDWCEVDETDRIANCL